MDILRALALLKRLLDDVPRLKSLASNPQNAELPTWDNEVRRIIRETFGRDSKEYARYDGVFLLKMVETQADKEQAYIDNVSQREKALKDIIKEHDLPVKVELHADGRVNTKANLESFHDGFIRYKELVMAKKGESLTSEQESELQTLSVHLQRSYGSLKEVIEKYGGPSVVLLQGGEYKCEAFSSAFNYTMFSSGALAAVMDTAIATLNMAIGELGKPVDSEQLPPEDNTMPKSVANWKAIENEFGINKRTFGRNINFVSDSFKRNIIFRDVEHSFVLASSGFSKSAVILAGGVIEELLRLYLKHHNISPISDNFDGYIKTCEQERLLKSGISRLSDSVRHFRNLVHLSNERTKRHTISKATAKGAVSSIFTIANDF